MKRLASGKASGHSFHVSLKALIIICSSQPKWDCWLGSLDCWRCVGRDPGSRLGFVFTSLVIIIIIFLHRTFYTWTSAPGMQQLAELWSHARRGPILFIFSLPHNLFIVLTGFLRIWWNHKHRTALPKQENREIRQNSSISFAAKEELLSELAPSGRRAGNLAIIVCKCPPSFLFHIWHWMAMTAKTEWKVFWVIYYAFG